MKYCFDTNALIDFSNLLGLEGEIVIPEIVIAEIDKLKMGFNETAYKARQAIRELKKRDNIKYDFNFGRQHVLLQANIYNNDDVILECAKEHGATIVTGDFNLELKAKASGVEVYDTKSAKDDDYSGYLELELNEDEIAKFYENIGLNHFNLLTNQYIILKNIKGEVVDVARWDGKQHQYARNKGFQTSMFGKFAPLDHYQLCALDSLYNNQMTMIKGKAGSGKSLITLNFAWQQIEKSKFDKLIIFTNPVATRNSAKLGYYPGTRNEKLLYSQTGTMLASKFGDLMEVERQISHGKLVLLPFSDIRGFDSTGQRAIIWFLESQNLDIDLMKTGISRAGSDSKVILDGDYSGQVDMDAYSGYNNGMRRVSEVFRGQPFYGEVELKKVHRSKMAEYADLL